MTRPPILITGTYRSGTTWVGKMMALSPEVHYVHEPFAPMYERSWLRTPPSLRYHHERSTVRGVYAEDLDRIVALKPPWLAIARRAGGVRNAARVAEEALRTFVARRRRARALIKDPFALLSAEWIANRVAAEVIVLVRHPAAFVSSVKRLGWRLDARWLLDQPGLMRGDLAPFKDALARDLAGELDLIDHAALMWRALNAVVLRYSRDHPEWFVLRYEDLAADPLPAFRDLYRSVDLTWNDGVAARIARLNSAENPSEVAPGEKGGVARNSRQATSTWHHRLTDAEIERVRAATEGLAEHWYSDADWKPA